jgi:hypothetical protein
MLGKLALPQKQAKVLFLLSSSFHFRHFVEEKRNLAKALFFHVSHFNWIFRFLHLLPVFIVQNNNTISEEEKFQLIQSRLRSLSSWKRHPPKEASTIKASLRAKLTTSNRDRPQININ